MNKWKKPEQSKSVEKIIHDHVSNDYENEKEHL